MTFKFGDLELDVSAYELRRMGRRVKLERIPMDLLILLVEREGDLVSRSEIVARLWGKESFVDSESGVNTAVRKVREALRDNPARPLFIQTVSGKGYRFCGSIVRAGSPPVDAARPREPTSEPLRGPTPAHHNGSAEPVEVAPPVSGPRGLGREAIVGALTAGVLLLAILSISRIPPTSSVSTPVTVALLPFENLTGDTTQEYFADGLTEETIAVLGKVNPNRMTVIARTSTMTYKGHTKTASQIGNELGADYLVEGSVRREAQRVRVTVKLIRVRDQSRSGPVAHLERTLRPPWPRRDSTSG
jgi:TolB-like protein/DNA-binding winged helix-turn-helix (wHTH) protein